MADNGGTGGQSSCGGQTGGPPCEDNPRTPKIILRSHGFIALAFGLALGITFMVFYAFVLRRAPGTSLSIWINNPALDIWISFAYGFIGGIAIALIYNLLVIRRFNLFGLEGNVD